MNQQLKSVVKPDASSGWAMPRTSGYPELLLQVGRRRRVLERQLIVRINVAVRLLRHQRDLVEAGQDELELARIGVDVANGEDAGLAGLEGLGAHRDHVLVELESPVRHRTELHGEPEERQHGV